MSTEQLPDQAAREAILADLNHNLVVEAAAGTGKTTCLVGRLMNLCLNGALSGDSRLAAVTFTLKAAAELRERLQRRLAEALADSGLGELERRNLRLAAANLPDCHIGTIHSFCARLLRERPVEAGVGPDFRELEEDDDILLRRRAWDEFSRELHGDDCRAMRAAFETFGLDRDTLGDGFVRYAEYPDIRDWPGADGAPEGIDVSAFMKGVDAFRSGMAALRPLLDTADCGTDKLLPILRLLDRRWSRLPSKPPLDALFTLSRLFKDVDKPVQTWWKQFGLTGEEAKERVEAYRVFCKAVVKPFRDSCLAEVYARALDAYRRAGAIYNRLRLENGVLNFQDLLMSAAALVRDFPEVREDLAGRYARLLIDEVQDTDPVQAELMFLLASADPRERDWRRCRPRPGSLFIVGDPKQSIYRFRRADIVVYQEIKNRIAATGGRTLGLSANFRSQPEILAWVNRTFLLAEDGEHAPEAVALSGKFSARECEYGPAYAPLLPGRPAAGGDSFYGVYALETVAKKKGVAESDIVRDEAARIAAFIGHAVESGMLLPDGGGVRPARPGDFLIVTYKKANGSVYADALRRLGLDAQLSSGGTLAGSPDLDLLAGYLDALARPDDGIALLAVLRGGLFGVSDEELYAWKKAGMAFDFLAPLKDAPFGPLAEAMTMLRRHYAALRNGLPAQALDGVATELGLWARACLGDDAARRAGMIATALELLKSEREAIPTPGALAERLRWHIANYEDEPLAAAATAGQAVRIMNLHKTKGLEAPVVFLASTRTVRKRAADFAVKRAGGRVAGGMCLNQGEFGNVVLARPREWDDLAAGEELFLAAERTRLNYVAATRAGAALVVSVHKTKSEWRSAFLPEFAPGATIGTLLPEPPAEWGRTRMEALAAEQGGAVDAAVLAAAERIRRETRPALLRRSYEVERAKPDGGEQPGGLFARLPESPWEAEAARDMGEVTHRLLEMDCGEDAVRDEAARLLREYGLPADRAEDAAALAATARRSAVWTRARAAEKRLRETPFAIWLKDGTGGTLRRGVIDLAFKEADGWVVVDYKTDSVPDGVSSVSAAGRHAAQLRHYRDAWEKLTGERVKEAGVYFIRRDEYVALSLR